MEGRIPNMKEKTLRYPGHIAYIQELQATGRPWTPDSWKAGDDQDEFTILRVNIDGTENGVERKISYTLFAGYDSQTGISSMARTTGYSLSLIHI